MVYPIEKFVSYQNFSRSHLAFLGALDSNNEPKNYNGDMKDTHWRKAMVDEIQALEDNDKWTIQELPARKRSIGCKWVYKIKSKVDEGIERYNACLVAKGFTKIQDIDFHETFVLVAKMTTVWCPILVALAWKLKRHQMDVDNAFSHGDLDEEVYMQLLLVLV